MNEQHLKYIDGMKGIACFCVMLGHYFGIYKYAQDASAIETSLMVTIKNSPWSIFVNESFWLFLFFVLSGYLLSLSRLEKFTDFVTKCIKRFMRLLLPIFFADLIIFGIYKLVGFYNTQTVAILKNTWWQSYYKAEISTIKIWTDPLKTLFLGGAELNSPYWVISDMFYASLLIYGCNFMKSKCKVEKHLCAVVCVAISYRWSYIVFSCVCGMLVQWYEENIRKAIKAKWIAGIFLIFVLVGCMLQFKLQWSMIYFSIFIIFLPYFQKAIKFFERKEFLDLGTISFGIYSFHWPVLCSVGARLLLMLYGKVNVSVVVGAVFAASVVITMLLAYAYHVSLERLSFAIIDKGESSLKRLVK